MDQDEGPGLGCRPQPLRHSLRRSTPINQPRHGTHIMNQPNEKPGYGNPGKTNCVFPPFPQPLLAIYTKYLTLPRPAVYAFLIENQGIYWEFRRMHPSLLVPRNRFEVPPIRF